MEIIILSGAAGVKIRLKAVLRASVGVKYAYGGSVYDSSSQQVILSVVIGAFKNTRRISRLSERPVVPRMIINSGSAVGRPLHGPTVQTDFKDLLQLIPKVIRTSVIGFLENSPAVIS